ncbi:DNA methyltransferase [Geobacter pickeringii]|uniref:DNA (cytosine-5-)-methyltransferase n=1 Tax=Geobacter pickeringii TaxID=345632 RepID=A0A0B5BL40_9BACT|nr:DNA methyltransferase [Geobacter pickeringii]
MRALELFCGIGGFAAAVSGANVRVVGSFDQDRGALDAYRLNFTDHGARAVDLERVGGWELTAGGIDFWWLSPPCQPYCERGTRRDLEDPRARSLLNLLELFSRIPDGRLPCHLAMENVAGFVGSEAHGRLTTLLASRGYHLRERLLCPTELGVPARRPRFYLAASRGPLAPEAPPEFRPRPPLAAYLGEECPDGLLLEATVLQRFGPALPIVDPADPAAVATCFTSGYGRSLTASGSYLRCSAGVRRFSPEEIARLLHFPSGFRFPPDLPLRKRWQLVGNSLSVAAVREVLRAFPALEGAQK